jgi:hypothetical protein
MTDIENVSLTPGHPAGCTCGVCECKRAHTRGEHADRVRDHGCCQVCDECADCEQAENDEAISRYSGELVEAMDLAVAAALSSAYQADAKRAELMSSRVYDIELAEGADGPDLETELAEAGLSLRRAQRIVRARKQLLGEGH